MKVYFYRPHAEPRDCAAIAYDADGNRLFGRVSSSLEWARRDMAYNLLPEGAEVEWVVGREAMQALIDSGAIKNLSFEVGRVNLDFDSLRYANLLRLPEFKNARGEPAHASPDGSDWSLGEWCNATLGELGEAANIIKKVRRGDMTLDEARPLLAREFADVVIYLDLLAYRAGVDLGNAVVEKWNETSVKIGTSVRLGAG